MDELQRQETKKEIQREVLALLDTFIEEEIDAMSANCTVAEMAREVLFDVQRGV